MHIYTCMYITKLCFYPRILRFSLSLSLSLSLSSSHPSFLLDPLDYIQSLHVADVRMSFLDGQHWRVSK